MTSGKSFAWWGANRANTHDGFGGKGVRAVKAKLNREKVLEIKRLLRRGKLMQTEIAKQFGVTPVTINSIKSGRLWFDIRLSDEEIEEIEREKAEA